MSMLHVIGLYFLIFKVHIYIFSSKEETEDSAKVLVIACYIYFYNEWLKPIYMQLSVGRAPFQF